MAAEAKLVEFFPLEHKSVYDAQYTLTCDDGIYYVDPEIKERNLDFRLATSILHSSVKSIGRYINVLSVDNHLSGHKPHIKVEHIEQAGYRHPVVIFEPINECIDHPDLAENDIFLHGLTEMNQSGSGLNLITTHALKNPSHRVISISTPGISKTGDILKIREGVNRLLEETATHNLEILPKYIPKDAVINLHGISLGSTIAMHMADLNINANIFTQQNIQSIKTISTAIRPRNIHDHDKFTDEDIENEEFISGITRKFFQHMSVDAIKTAIKHPEDAAKSLDVLLTYLAEPHKMLHRYITLSGNLKGAQLGVDWSSIVNVMSNIDTYVLNGELDPLTEAQIPKWRMLQKKHSKNLVVWIVKGYGHSLPLHANATTEYLKDMKSIKAAF